MKTLIINLNSRPDRLATVTAEVERFGISDYMRFSAYDGGIIGFNRSMHEALQGEKEILLLEDDCEFTGTLQDLIEAKAKLPDDWDLLYLGANVLEPQKKYCDGIYHLQNGWTSHAILYSDKGADYCAKNYNPFAGVIYDEWLRTVAQKELKCFIVMPMLAVQADGYSDIWQQETVYDLKQTEKYLI
jgi:GR25 family glycosyltransferase involved in LPS biosynthesis